MSNAPEVTVAIINYNGMPYLPLAIASVLAQTYTDFELLITDDGSTDDSLHYIRTVSDPRVRVYADGVNRKLNVRLNESVSMARGKYYFRMDADDVMLPDRIERQLPILRAAGSNCIVGGGAISIDRDGGIRGSRPPRIKFRHWWEARHAFIHPTVATETELLRANPYSEHFMFHRSQDAELWCRLYGRVKYVNIDAPLIFYRESSDVSLENYLATGYGLLTIIYRSKRSIMLKIALGTIELTKVYCYFMLGLAGISRFLVRYRCRKLPPEKSRQFADVYRTILSPAVRAES